MIKNILKKVIEVSFRLIKKFLSLKLRYKVISLLLVLTLIGGGFYFYKQQSLKEIVELQTSLVVREDLTNSMILSGNIASSNLISVMTKTSGVVKKVYVTDGQVVKAGDKIAEITLDSEGKNSQSSAWSSYLSAKNSLESAKTKQWSLESSMWVAHEKFEADALDTELSVDDPIFIQTQRDWLAAEATYKNQAQAVIQAQASVTQAWNNYQLYQATITAPQDGIVVGLSLAEGLSVSYNEGSSGNASSQTVATLKTAGSPVASFSVTEVDINKIKVGQEVTLTLDSIEDQVFSGSIVAVDRVGETSSSVTQYPVLVKFNEDSTDILTNMAVDAEIILDSRQNVLVVPLSSVNQFGNKKIVKVMKEGKSVPVEVETGLETETEVEIVSGLNEGDVILSGNKISTTTSDSSDNQERGGGNLMMLNGPGGGGGSVRGAMSKPH